MEILAAVVAAVAAALVAALFGGVKWLADRRKNQEARDSVPPIPIVVTVQQPSPELAPNNPDIPVNATRWEGRPPTSPNNFVGRQADIDRVAEAMNGSGAAVISGGAGMGKSRLAAEYTDTANLQGFWSSAGNTAELTLAALAPRLGLDVDGRSDAEMAADVSRTLFEMPPVVVWVIDNLPAIGQLDGLLAAVGPVKLLVTTRDSRQYLKPDAVAFLKLSELDADAAIELLRSKGGHKADETVL